MSYSARKIINGAELMTEQRHLITEPGTPSHRKSDTPVILNRVDCAAGHECRPVEQTPKRDPTRTVRVRMFVAVDVLGNYVVDGWNDSRTDDLRKAVISGLKSVDTYKTPCHVRIIEADVDLPVA